MTKAITEIATTEPKTIKGSPKWGDLMLRIVAGLVLLYLFLPIFVIILFSFNNPKGKFNYSWQGFTLKNWADPFKYPALTDALKLSLNVAAVSTAIALVLGRWSPSPLCANDSAGRTAVDTFLIIPLTAPEVVMGAALLTLFLDFGWAAGYTTILIAHIAFEISFIAMTVRARMRGFDWTLEDASMDLGASPTRTFFKVTLPLIIPGIVAAGMLSFALSLDDFIITYFVSGSTVTYPLYVNAAVKAAVPPQINVLATAILADQPDPARRGNAVPAQANRGLVQRDQYLDAALLVAVGDRVPGAVGAVELQQCDRATLAEEVAPPRLGVG